MRHLLLASAAMLFLAMPALADSLEPGVGAASETTVPESTTLPAAGSVAGEAPESAPDAVTATQLIGLTVVDANGDTVGEVSNAVLSGSTTAVSQVVIHSGGFFGFGGRDVAVDAANVDTSTAGEGTVTLRNLTAADLETMADFEAGESVRLLNPS
jgi:sporulation protein YlmC with PRC-barrel domain